MKTTNGRPAHPVMMLVLVLGLSSAALLAGERTPANAQAKPYSFTRDTFTDKIPAWSKILAEFKGRPGVNYLEIGTFEGRSALWVVENILTHPTAKLTVIDVFVENNYKRFISNINLSGQAHKFNILSGYSTPKLREVPLNSIDFAYVDGSGKGIVMLSDLVNTWNLVKVNGMIISTRYSLNAFLMRALALQPGDPGPQEALGAFLNLYKPYMSVVAFQDNYVIVRKVRSAE